MRIKMNRLKLFASHVFSSLCEGLRSALAALLCRLNPYALKRKWGVNLTSKIKVWWPLSTKHLSRGNLDRK